MSKTIFLVDDEDLVLEMTTIFLEKRGFIVKSFLSAEEMLDNLKSAKPDLVIIDHMLPGLNGDEATHQIKSNDETKDIPVMMATAQVLFKQPLYGNPDLIRPNKFLFKPFQAPDLMNALEEFFPVESNVS